MGMNKPFNPLLGETFELEKPGQFRLISEQVSHHPPVSAFFIEGTAAYHKYATFHTKTSFGMGTMGFANVFNEYLDLLHWDERYEFNPPALTFYGLIMGTPYIDINSTAILKNISRPNESYAEVKYHGRGWTQNSYFKVEGKIYKGKEVVITFEGKWNESVSMKDLRTGVTEVVWTKRPYPENWERQYGMTHHSMQLNYLPNWMRDKLPPTDSRFRPD
jgi:hypothetical protein